MTDGDITAVLLDGDRYPENPYMSLLTEALREQGVTVLTPALPLFFPLTRTVLRTPEADVLAVDWVYDYYSISVADNDALDVVASVLRAAALLVDLLVVSLLSVAVVWTVHNERHHEGKFPRTERVVNETLFAVADAVTVKCHAAAETLAETYTLPSAAELHVVPDGSYVSAYENEVSATAAREELSIPEDAFVYLFFGLIREYKGVPELIEAFGALKAPEAELWIVGNPHTDELAREIDTLAAGTPGVETVFEFVPDERIQYYMTAADVFALPYRRVLNSGSAHLGLSYGLPIVAPALGCLPETLPPENDFLYDPADDDGLRRELRRARDHPDLEAVGRANYRRAIEDDWTDTAEAMVGAYRRALGRSVSVDLDVGVASR